MAEGELTVTLSEEITLHGAEFSPSASITYSNIEFYDKNIKLIGTSLTELYTCSDDGTSADYDWDKVLYTRITNLDDTNSVFIEMQTSNGEWAYVEIVAKGSFIIQKHNGYVDDDGTQEKIDKVQAAFETAEGYIEIFIARIA